MDCSLPGSSIHGILQARILGWVAISFSRGSSRPRDRTQVSHIAGRRFTLWATLCSLINYTSVLKSGDLPSKTNFSEVEINLNWEQSRKLVAVCFFCLGINKMYMLLTILMHVLKQKALAPCSSTLAWKIPWTEEPGGLQTMGSLRVGYDWATSLSLFTCMHWIRQWQPTPVFLPGESQGRGSLVGCHLWGRTELDTTEVS